jgi:hypothetical protein
MSEQGYKQAFNCERRQREIQHRIHETQEEIEIITQRLAKLLNTVTRLGYDLSILTANSCCQDPDCPECRDRPEKSEMKNCNVTVDLRRDCVGGQ